uniref:Uncharacterized protein n=1 Tax=viral metagenome TaxID=1070528 RepID=A0A6M3L359_9ZZZZ
MTKKWQREERIQFDHTEYQMILDAYADGNQHVNIRQFIKDMVIWALGNNTEYSASTEGSRSRLIYQLESQDESLMRLAILAIKGREEASTEFLAACSEFGVDPETYLGVVESAERQGISMPSPNSDVAKCTGWLRTVLADRQYTDSKSLIDLASRAGFPYMCFYRACKLLGVSRRRRGMAHQVALNPQEEPMPSITPIS